MTTINVEIIGRRWRQRSMGTTYHSVKVLVNGEYAGQTDFTYGYGNMYMETGKEHATNYIQDKFGFTMADRTLERQEQNVNIEYTVTDVKRKKDLAFNQR